VTDLLSAEHVLALAAIALSTAVLVTAARRRPGAWLRWLAIVLLVDEVSWWVYLLAGGVPNVDLRYALPLQLCDVAIFIAAAALWTRNRLLVEITYFWGLAGTIQALLTPDLPQHFPTYPYWQYYVAHGGVIASALILVVGLRIRPRRWAVVRVGALTVAYAAFVGAIDVVTGANYMYLRAKPPVTTPLDAMGPWPVYIAVAAAVAFVLFAVLDAPFRLRTKPAIVRTIGTSQGTQSRDSPD
jgi:hypothetical integral membrane protein (TIGR02206 family)